MEIYSFKTNLGRIEKWEVCTGSNLADKNGYRLNLTFLLFSLFITLSLLTNWNIVSMCSKQINTHCMKLLSLVFRLPEIWVIESTCIPDKTRAWGRAVIAVNLYRIQYISINFSASVIILMSSLAQICWYLFNRSQKWSFWCDFMYILNHQQMVWCLCVNYW